jgi:hypothetical protein
MTFSTKIILWEAILNGFEGVWQLPGNYFFVFSLHGGRRETIFPFKVCLVAAGKLFFRF